MVLVVAFEEMASTGPLRCWHGIVAMVFGLQVSEVEALCQNFGQFA